MQITVEDIINNTSAKLLNGNKNIIINECFVDSNKVEKDSCFFGIKGDNTDGSLFYKEAILNGANVLILSKRKDYNFNGYEHITILIADDTKKVLQELAAYKRSLFKGIVIGITGSVGKTNTKELVSNILRQNYKVLSTEGNQNSQIGMPLTILKLKDEDIMVLEMGMSNLGDIHKLSLIAKPDISVITNIYSSHIKNLKTNDNILKAKLEIIDGMNENGILILNNDNEYLEKLNINKNLNIFTYGINNKSNIMPTNIRKINNNILFSIGDIDNFKVIGSNDLIYNVLPSYLIAKLLGVSRSMIKNGINDIPNINRRLNLIELNHNIKIIDDTYNASYESIKVALDYLNTYDLKKVFIVGDILELGNKSKYIHKQVGDLVKKYNINKLITVGKYSKIIGKRNKKIWLKHIKKESDFKLIISKIIEENTIYLVKGSNGINMKNIVTYLKEGSF